VQNPTIMITTLRGKVTLFLLEELLNEKSFRQWHSAIGDSSGMVTPAPTIQHEPIILRELQVTHFTT